MQDIVIVGAGGLGRECCQFAEDINAAQPTWRVIGFIDDDPRKHGTEVHGLPVLGGVDWVAAHPGEVAAIIGIGGPVFKRRIVERLRPHVTGFPVVRHPMASIGRTVALGEGTVVGPGAVLTADITVGAFVTINYGLTVGHDVRIASFATISPGVNLSGYVSIGEGVDLGCGVATVPSVEVGAWSIVGAGAVVTRSLPANCTAVGVPARVIKTRAEGWHR